MTTQVTQPASLCPPHTPISLFLELSLDLQALSAEATTIAVAFLEILLGCSTFTNPRDQEKFLLINPVSTISVAILPMRRQKRVTFMFLCQLHWATGCPDIQLNGILGALGPWFPDKGDFRIRRRGTMSMGLVQSEDLNRTQRLVLPQRTEEHLLLPDSL